MKLAFASGKGGTGKTTLAVAMALASPQAVLLDCDVEEPNVHLFMPGVESRRQVVETAVPRIDMALCDQCRVCVDFCQFNALAVFPGQTLVFPELCHSCGGCTLVCPRKAITEVPRRIGELVFGAYRQVQWIQGRLDVGQSMSPPLIRAVLGQKDSSLTLIDAPPGTSCPMVTAVTPADYVILVTEPTPFGLNDLKLAVDTLRQLEKPFGVIINRADAGDDGVRRYCQQEGLELWLEIPMKREIAEVYALGGTLLDALPGISASLENILSRLISRSNGAPS